jgi:hypothetical protein
MRGGRDMNMDYSEVLMQAISHYMAKVYTCLPAAVVKYDATKKMATVKPLIKMKFNDGEELTMPEIPSVPVMFAGTKKSVIMFELKEKDTGLVLFSTRALELWLKGNGQEASAGSPRKFALSDGIFLPGLFPFSAPGKVGAGKGLEILHSSGGIVFQDDGTLEINGKGKNFVTHAELNTALQQMLLLLNADIVKANGQGGTATGLTTLDISAAKTEKVVTG